MASAQQGEEAGAGAFRWVGREGAGGRKLEPPETNRPEHAPRDLRPRDLRGQGCPGRQQSSVAGRTRY